jgi:hypothetical protein
MYSPKGAVMVKHLLELAARPFKGSRLSGTRAQRQQPRQRRRRWQQQQQQLQQRSNVMSTHSVITLREEVITCGCSKPHCDCSSVRGVARGSGGNGTTENGLASETGVATGHCFWHAG